MGEFDDKRKKETQDQLLSKKHEQADQLHTDESIDRKAEEAQETKKRDLNKNVEISNKNKKPRGAVWTAADYDEALHGSTESFVKRNLVSAVALTTIITKVNFMLQSARAYIEALWEKLMGNDDEAEEHSHRGAMSDDDTDEETLAEEKERFDDELDALEFQLNTVRQEQRDILQQVDELQQEANSKLLEKVKRLELTDILNGVDKALEKEDPSPSLINKMKDELKNIFTPRPQPSGIKQTAFEAELAKRFANQPSLVKVNDSVYESHRKAAENTPRPEPSKPQQRPELHIAPHQFQFMNVLRELNVHSALHACSAHPSRAQTMRLARVVMPHLAPALKLANEQMRTLETDMDRVADRVQGIAEKIAPEKNSPSERVDRANRLGGTFQEQFTRVRQPTPVPGERKQQNDEKDQEMQAHKAKRSAESEKEKKQKEQNKSTIPNPFDTNLKPPE